MTWPPTGFSIIPFMIVGNLCFGLSGIIWSTLAADMLTLVIGLGILFVTFRRKPQGALAEEA